MDTEQESLLEIIRQFPQKKIVVWGDFILDEYLYGTTQRISREAPVLILSRGHTELFLGGAGNSLLNLYALGAEPIPVGVVGQDDAGDRIRGILKKKGIPSSYVFTERDYKTPIKTRIFAGEETAKKQQVLRIDQESMVPDKEELAHRLMYALNLAKSQSSALLISDYNYFSVQEYVFSHILPTYKNEDIPVALDSRFRILNFRGITIATPNEPEVEEAVSLKLDESPDAVKDAGRTLLRKMAAEALLLTRGSKGMVLFEKGKRSFEIPIHGTTDIVDMTGAGDTVVSVLTLALACGASFKEAAQLANYAGGIVVMKKGTAILTPKELEEAVVSKR
jgi:rfaE bifunctional protein kinase chain/domain